MWWPISRLALKFFSARRAGFAGMGEPKKSFLQGEALQTTQLRKSNFLTFATLLFLFRASPEEFRTGWFIESLITELVIALVVRTRQHFFHSRLGTLLLVSTLIFSGITLVLPYLPFISVFGFAPLPAPLLLTMLGLTALYILATEVTKKYFYSRVENDIV